MSTSTLAESISITRLGAIIGIEKIAVAVGFRAPDLDETFEAYERALSDFINETDRRPGG